MPVAAFNVKNHELFGGDSRQQLARAPRGAGQLRPGLLWPAMYVFSYGSLLNVESLMATIPGIEAGECIPAVLAGHVRTFDVAFPNEGSQGDKSYFDPAGVRPPVVLFVNLRPSRDGHVVNGVLVPVSAAQLEALRRRELRYDVVDVTGAVHGADRRTVGREVVAFVGRTEFTQAVSVAQGVVAHDYLATITAGVEHWDVRCPGFKAQFEASTRVPSSQQIVALRRVDAVD